MFGGVRIVTSLLMVEDGEPYEVRRTWRERLFSVPWRPMQATLTVVPKVPKRVAVRLPDGAFVMHPDVAAELRKASAELRCDDGMIAEHTGSV